MNGTCLLPEDIFSVFASAGFSRYEAKVHATLCACGRMKMEQLAEYSMVPQSRICTTEQMAHEQMIFRYENPTGIVIYSKNPVVREKVLF